MIADGIGRAVGYMFGNVDFSLQKNSQHQCLVFKLDNVARITGRRDSPPNSPLKLLSYNEYSYQDVSSNRLENNLNNKKMKHK